MSRSSHHHRLLQQQQQQQQQQMLENDAAALAAELFDHFCVATTMRQVLGLYRNMCDTLGLRAAPLNEFYPKLKAKIRNWKAQALWKKFDARAAHRVYNKANACTGTRVLVIGAGPCGLRTAIEAQLLGAKVVVIEKRDRISRNNVLHLWPFVITDLRNLGAKKFYGKFCAGSIDHISIRQLQCILLKVALLLGVEVHEGVSFYNIIEPSDGCGWRAQVSPEDHAVSHYEFDVLIGADGKRNTLEGFRRKEFRGKLAIAITANFINKKTEAEAKAEEISGVAFIFNQSFFKELYQTTGIDLENIVYYKDETHYFVMTAKKHSLIDKGVIMQDYTDPAELLSAANVNTDKLLDYAREAAEFSTKYQMPNLEFAVNHYGKPDVAMFDFTSMFAAEASCRVLVRKNYRLFQCLVGDSLLEPFWPTGSGCARGFLSSMDAAFAIKLWSNQRNSSLAVLAQRESIYRLLGQTTPENLQRDIGAYTVDPTSRYPNLNTSTVNVWQVKHLLDTDDPSLLEQTFIDSNAIASAPTPETPVRRKRRTGDTLPLSTVLLRWVKAQLHAHEFTQNLTEVSECFTGGKVLCALINRYRPDLVDLSTITGYSAVESNELAFKILEKELGIARVILAKDSVNLYGVDSKIWLNYLEQVCEVFRGEIPHVKHPKLDISEFKEKSGNNVPDFSRLLNRHTRKVKSPMQDIELPQTVHRRSVLDEEKVRRQRKIPDFNPAQADTTRRAKKRRSHEKTNVSIEERQQRLHEIEENRVERQSKRRQQRYQQTQNFYKSLHMLQANNLLRESGDGDSSSAFEDYSLYMYRQQAPEFKDRVKDMEQKILYPDRERGIQSSFPRGGANDEQFNDRIRYMEQRITSRNAGATDKKPKDLLRAIGKIESSDWNIREIEKKIEQSKKTEVGKSREKVPKWSKEQFLARQNKMSKPTRQESVDEKFKDIDQTLKNFDKQLKEGSILEVGERGRNKVASIAGQFVKKDDTSEEKNVTAIQKPHNAKVNLVFSKQNASEKCHFCKQTVYLMEKISTEGLILHRSCLKCHHCHTNLRLGGYAFDRDDPVGRFYCTQHFRLPAKPTRPIARKSMKNHKKAGDEAGVEGHDLKTPDRNRVGRVEDVAQLDLLDRGQTPERIEFENADALSDGEPSLENIMDENEWTDRNFITGSEESESDLSSSDESDDGTESDMFEEANGSPIGQQTLQLATDWIGKQRYANMSDDSDDEDFYDSSEGMLDDDNDSQTEGEEFKKAREMRRQEVKVMPPPSNLQTDTETEVQTDTESSSSNAREQNSATEISTDSEFEHDPIIHEAPRIFIDDTHLKKPTKVQIKQGMIVNNSCQRAASASNIRQAVPKRFNNYHKPPEIELEFKPLVQVDPSLLTSNRMPLKNPRPGDYLLNKTPSTEGIASKKSLELKKRYLLGGEQGIGIGIMKSGSTSILDSRLKSFQANISECQKLLNPGSDISPGMKNFLDRTKIGEVPTIKTENKNSQDEKENVFVNSQNELNKEIEYSESINSSTIVEKKLPSSITETINLITPEKPTTVRISETYNAIATSDKMKIQNQALTKRLEREQDSNKLEDTVIDLTVDSPIIKGVEDSSIEKPDVSKDIREIKPDIIAESEEVKPEKRSITAIDSNKHDKEEEDEACLLKNNDVQETCIAVPNIPWNNSKNNKELESDSMSVSSSSSSSSLEDIPHYILDSTTSPDTHNGCVEQIVPRLEVHDTSGTLMQIDSLMIIDGQYVGDPEDLKLLEIPEGTKINLPSTPKDEGEEKRDEMKEEATETLMSQSSKPDLKFDTKNENKIDTLKNIPLVLDKEKKDDAKTVPKKPKTLELEGTSRTRPSDQCLPVESDKDKTPTAERPLPGGHSDSETEVTGPVLTETELSDWTADDAVSENFVDIEFALNSNKGTIKRSKKSKKSKVKSSPNDKSPAEKAPTPLSNSRECGILKNLDIEEIEFMDTGSEGSYAEAYSATNTRLLQNRGYIHFIDNTNTNVTNSNLYKKPEPMRSTHPGSQRCSESKEILGIDYIEQGAYILANDLDLKTPVNEVPPIFAMTSGNVSQEFSPPSQTVGNVNDVDDDSLLMISSQGTTTDTITTTEESEALTVVTSPLETPKALREISSFKTSSSSDRYDKTISNNESNPSTAISARHTSRKSSGEEPRKRLSQEDVSVKRKDSEELSYEEYVRKLQLKISQISSARDSIDVRKQKRKSSKGDLSASTVAVSFTTPLVGEIQNNSVIENSKTKNLSIFDPPTPMPNVQPLLSTTNTLIIENTSITNNRDISPSHGFSISPMNSGGVTQRLEEITKERTKQKDLIHDLVMDKLQQKKQLNAEKRLNRSRNRSSLFSPSSSPKIALPISHELPTNGCSNTPHYHLSSAIPFTNNSTLQNSLKSEKYVPKDIKDVAKVFPVSVTSKDIQRPISSDFETQLEAKKITPKLYKTQSFCAYSTRELNRRVAESLNPGLQSSLSNLATTPAPPLRTVKKPSADELTANTDKLRAEARARARLKSNQDLGLSPDEKLQILRKRYHLDLEDAINSESKELAKIIINKSDDMKVRERKMMTSKSVNDITSVQNFLNSDENFNTKISPSKVATDFTSDPNLMKTQDKQLPPKGNRRCKDPERRKSLIQTVSNFFHKGGKKSSDKDSPTSPNKEKQQDGVFSRFRISPKSKSKDKNGSQNGLERSQQDFLKNDRYSSSSPQLFKGFGDDASPPPIPPLPLNYQRSDDESNANETREQKKQRALSKASRQAELKRLRIAQEIQREQEEIEVKLKELEATGVLIEKALRGEGQNMETLDSSTMGANDEKLLKELLEIWRNITQIKIRDEELGIRQQELQLEHRHAQLKEELNVRLSCSKLDKSSADVAAEGAILNEMLEIVAKRAALRPCDVGLSSIENEIDM